MKKILSIAVVTILFFTFLAASSNSEQSMQTGSDEGSVDPPDAFASSNETNVAVNGGPLYYIQTAAAFRPRSSSTEYSFNGPRLRTISAPTSYDAPLDLPNGAEISRLVIYYTDNDAALDFSAEMWRVPLPGRSGEQVSQTVRSTSVSGSATFVETTDILLPTVDLEGYAYYIRLSLPVSSDLEINGLRVDYSLPSSNDLMLFPIIIKR